MVDGGLTQLQLGNFIFYLTINKTNSADGKLHLTQIRGYAIKIGGRADSARAVKNLGDILKLLVQFCKFSDFMFMQMLMQFLPILHKLNKTYQ